MGDMERLPAAAIGLSAIAVLAVFCVVGFDDASAVRESDLDTLFKGPHSKGVSNEHSDMALAEEDLTRAFSKPQETSGECDLEQHDGYTVRGSGKACCDKRFADA